jgi:uncharacterized protein YbjT (DUF2867 family)
VAQIVTVFGGTGFLGRRIVRHLHDKGFSIRIASRRPNPSGDDPPSLSIAADIYEGPSVAKAVAGAFGVVNAVSLYVERGMETFDAMHVTAAETLASEARRAGLKRFRYRGRCTVIFTLYPRPWPGRASRPRHAWRGDSGPTSRDVWPR